MATAGETVKVKALRPINVGGTRREAGETCEIPAVLAESFGPDYVEVVRGRAAPRKAAGTPADKQAGSPTNK